jgi:divalent metal cation (Fe/Co/Zn/Cd) transporter
MYEGIDKMIHPHDLDNPIWAIGILSVAIILEGFSLRVAIIECRKIKCEESWWSFIRRSKVPELPVVLLEDLGALVGLFLALIGIGLAMVTGNPVFDAVGTIGIGILLGVIAIVLAIEMRSLLLGEAASADVQQKLKDSIEGHPGVVKLIHMRTQHIGPEELLVAVDVEFSKDMDVKDVTAAIDALEENIRRAVPIAKMIYIEPDVVDNGQ